MEGFKRFEEVRELINNDSYLIEKIEQWLDDDRLAELAEDIAKEEDLFLEDEE